MTRSAAGGPMRAAVVLVAAVAALATGPACRKESPVPSGTLVSAEYPTGRCDVTITGGAQLTFTTPGGPANVATVYWMTDAELRKYFAWRAREEKHLQVSEEDVNFFVDQAMSKNPRYTPLLIRCPSEAATVTLAPGMGSRYEDVPFRPAVYRIAPAFEVEDAVQGLFAAQTMIVVGQEVVKFTPKGYGSLSVTAFDEHRLAGVFTYTAEAAGRTVEVSARFDFRRPAAAPVVATR